MILPYRSKWPEIHETAFVAPSADIIGDVVIGSHSNIWFQCVLRGDVHSIRIGARTNVQDHTMIHVTRGRSPATLGDDVTVGHRALIHGCKVGNRVLIGMGAIIMDDVEIGDDSVVGAGSLVTMGKKFPPGSLIMGAPAKMIRPLNDEERAYLIESAANYVRDAADYKSHVQGPVRLGQDDYDLEEGYEQREE